MKKFLLAASALVTATAIAGAANAADLAPAPASAYDWSGFYFGLNAGVAWNNSELDNDLEYTGEGFLGGPSASDINEALDALENDLEGDDAVFTGGAMLGYNWQQDSFVLGVEADFNYLGFSEDRSRDISGVLSELLDDDITGSSEASFDANWYGTLRARLGVAADNFLFYGTGGLAYGHMEASVDISGTDGENSASFEADADDTNWGWTIGAGMEYGIDNWSLGLEYLYVDLGTADWDGDIDENIGGAYTEALDNVDGKGDVDYQFSVVRATAKIRF